jgi:hypothetical protein
MSAPAGISEADASDFTESYIASILWVNVLTEDGHGELVTSDDAELDDVSQDALEAMRDDCEAWLEIWAGSLLRWVIELGIAGYDWAAAGHDFALTRNGHGAGYWDRGLGRAGAALTVEAKTWGEFTLWQDAGTGEIILG